MILPLPKKLRITRLSRRMAMGISLFSLVSGTLLAAPPTIPVPAIPVVPTMPVPANPPVPMIQPPASLPTGAPRPRLVPADTSPYTPTTPGVVPGAMMSFQKPEGEDKSKRVDKAQPSAKVEGRDKIKNTIPPITRENAFRLDNDQVLYKRAIKEIVKETKDQKTSKADKDEINEKNYRLPTMEPLVQPGATFLQRSFAPTTLLVEPSYVVHRRLLFEELNAERHGWDFGIAQPLISTAHFYVDTVLWPARLASNLHERYDTSAGKCPPGSPVPYFLYPPEVTLFGAAVGFTVLGASAAIFP